MRIKFLNLVFLIFLLNSNCSKEINKANATNENKTPTENPVIPIQISNNSQIPITETEIKTNFAGGLLQVIRFKNLFYFISSNYNSVNSSSYSFTNILKLYEMNEHGEVKEMKLDLNRLNEFHLELFENGDKIFLADKENHLAKYLTEQGDWIELEKKYGKKIFENEVLIVHSENFGEWGGNTWVFDKITKEEYEIKSFFTNVSEFNNAYYFSNFSSVFKLSDIKSLEKAGISYAEFLSSNKFNKYDNGYDVSSMEPLFSIKENTYNEDDKISIHNSFVFHDELYFLYSLNGEVQIGVLKDKEFISKIKFHNLKLRNTFLRNNANSTKSAVYFTQGPEKSGLIEMSGEGIKVYHILNEFTQKIYSNEEMFHWMIQQLNHNLENLGKLSIEEISKLEKNAESIDITTDNGISKSYLDEYKSYNRRKIFRKKEENGIDLITEYFYDSHSNKVGAMAFIWDEDKFIKGSKVNVTGKFKSLFDFLETKYGKPTEVDETENRSIYIWKINNSRAIKLQTNSKELSLRIFRQ